MTLILESPLIVGIVGALVVIATLYGFLQTGRKETLYVAGGLLVATIALVLIGRYVETEPEKIRKMIYQTADDLEANNVPAVLARIHPTASSIADRAEAELDRYTFEIANVTKIHDVEYLPEHKPPKAVVKMNVIVKGSFDSIYAKVPRYVELKLYKNGDQWQVYDYQHAEPLAGLRGQN